MKGEEGYVRNVIGCAASPASVTVPFMLAHYSDDQDESLLC
jgi:hypothetical protein